MLLWVWLRYSKVCVVDYSNAGVVNYIVNVIHIKGYGNGQQDS